MKDPRTGKETIKSSGTDLYLHAGFKPGHIYEFIYPAKNPLGPGLGLRRRARFRFILALRVKRPSRQSESAALAVPSPVLRRNRREDTEGELTGISYAYAWGRSQSGRFLRDFVYHGFNEDESHRKVFDAIAPHVAGGGRLFLNYEFARPVTSSQQHTNQLDPELFPHAYNIIKDAQTGRRDGILKRPKTDPLFSTRRRRRSTGKSAAAWPIPTAEATISNFRTTSASTSSPAPSTTAPSVPKPAKDDSQFLVNPLPAGDVLRALMVAMDLWVTKGSRHRPAAIRA